MAESGTKLRCARHPVQASARGQPSAVLVGGEAEALPVLGAPEGGAVGPCMASGPSRWPAVHPGPGWPAEGVQDGIRLSVNKVLHFMVALPGEVRSTSGHTQACSRTVVWMDRAKISKVSPGRDP